jgi:membrane protease subunit HflK
MAGNSGGPWGGGSGGGGGGGDDGNRGKRPGEGPSVPDIDRIMKKGQEQLRVLMGGRSGGPRGPVNGGGGGVPSGPWMTRNTLVLGGLAAVALWAFASFYTVRPEEQSVELFLGEYASTGNPGLNFAPWPLVTAEVIPVTREQTLSVGVSSSNRGEEGLMLTTDENIVDIDFQVVWNINDPAKFLFNLAEPEQTIAAVSESAMREIIAASELAPILNRDRGLVASSAQELIQATLDSYNSGVTILRVNLDKADPPREVIDAFRDVQAAEQERDRSEREADAYANRVLAGARGEAAQVLEQAEAYRAQQVNQAQGEAARFLSVLAEYQNAPEVTRKRLYLETMERVLGAVDKIILDPSIAGADGSQGVVPFLPLNELRRPAPAAPATGGSN